MPRCANCPVAAGRVCPSARHPRYCDLAGRPGYDAVIRSRAGDPPPPPEAPETFDFPARAPGDRRVRAGVLSPSCYLGGADLWVGDLLGLTDPARIHWVGAAVRDLGLVTPEVRDAWAAHAPFAAGPGAIRALAASVDVLVAWGVHQSWGFPAGTLAPLIGRTPLLHVSHGSRDEALVPPGGLLAGATAAAVSRAALRGLPEADRAGARVILNQVSPDRVRRTRSVAETRASWGLPPGARVAGWLGRVATEKRPEVFVRAVAALPPGWHGVVAGIGYAEESTRALAEEVAPGRVVFLGGRHDVGDVLAAFDCMAMPTVSEACSLAAAEAWLAGCPLISTEAGLLEEHPELARPIPNPPTPADLAAAILADAADPIGTAARAELARTFAGDRLSPARFARDWTKAICEAAGRPAAAPAPAAAPRESPAARIGRCPDRGSILPLSMQEGGCGCRGRELTECRAGKGRIPGRVTTADCLACVGAG